MDKTSPYVKDGQIYARTVTENDDVVRLDSFPEDAYIVLIKSGGNSSKGCTKVMQYMP